MRTQKEAERVLLGCFFQKPEAFMENSEGLKVEHFQHYGLIADTYWKIIDEDKIPGEIEIAELTDQPEVFDFYKYAHFDQLEEAKEVLIKNSKRKQIKEILDTIHNNIEDHDFILTQIENLNTVLTQTEEEDFSLRKVAIEFVKDLIDNPDKPVTETIPSSLPYLNKTMGGWNKTDLSIIAGRPGMGKTALALQEAKYAAMKGYKPAIVSLEMSRPQLNMRLVTQQTALSKRMVEQREITEAQRQRAIKAGETNAGWDMKIYDKPEYWNCDAIYHLGRRLAARGEIDLMIIDYLQLIGTTEKFGTDNSRVSWISRRMKQLAMNANIPVILLSQLSREVEKRTDKKPQLSDLRDSGAIEQDADVVLFSYRPSYYNIENQSDEIIIAKNRHSGTGTCYTNFIGERMIFESQTPEKVEMTELAKQEDEDVPF